MSEKNKVNICGYCAGHHDSIGSWRELRSKEILEEKKYIYRDLVYKDLVKCHSCGTVEHEFMFYKTKKIIIEESDEVKQLKLELDDLIQSEWTPLKQQKIKGLESKIRFLKEVE